MFKRDIETTLQKGINSFPVIVVTGPRQSGKTTELRKLLPDYAYVSFESADTLLDAQDDPRGFLKRYPDGLIIDEAQHYPEIFSYIQEIVDADPKPGQYVLSGSQNFLLAEQVSQTLAGRAVILELLPLSYREYLTDAAPIDNMWEYLYTGSYPRPYHEKLDTDLWYNSYIRTYLERDVRSIVNVKNLSTFQLFLKLCAGRHGQLLNMNNLAQDCGLSHTTISQWLNILEASYIIYRLQPYHNNFKKRQVKTPKLYFYDSAIVCQLTGIESPEHLQTHSSRGAIFEGFVLSEIQKHYYAKGKRAPLYFWRDQSGNEVDGIIERAGDVTAIEIKSSATASKSLLTSLQKWQNISGNKPEDSQLIYGGDKSLSLENINIRPWNDLSFLT
tara:strand:- start:35544 stop:36704 length:1161 start_codon:yes stop_codon:yes gene_type:complete